MYDRSSEHEVGKIGTLVWSIIGLVSIIPAWLWNGFIFKIVWNNAIPLVFEGIQYLTQVQALVVAFVFQTFIHGFSYNQYKMIKKEDITHEYHFKRLIIPYFAGGCIIGISFLFKSFL